MKMSTCFFSTCRSAKKNPHLQNVVKHSLEYDIFCSVLVCDVIHKSGSERRDELFSTDEGEIYVCIYKYINIYIYIYI
jgi:hypothetical protein